MEDNPSKPALTVIRGLSKVEKRAIQKSTEIALDPPTEISFQHTILCQTSLPYRDPGDHVREWDRRCGFAHLLLEAGSALDPRQNKYVKLGLPFGPKPRLILCYLNTEALKTGSPIIDVQDTLTSFVKRIQDPSGKGKNATPNGREIKAFKVHLSRLSVAKITLGMVNENARANQVNSHFVEAVEDFDLWFPKNENQRVLWPSTIQLNDRYFKSLAKHAVPLDERALCALAHSAMALDIYSWLAQRLHRIDPNKNGGEGEFVAWFNLKEQFGQGYGRMTDFRGAFLKTLEQVWQQYRAANFEVDKEKGIYLKNSKPPVPKRLYQVIRKIE
ncbi:MAG: hypothetical protein KC643_11845 [Nitrospira sp.]|nr:hypothetical protein [Nitrospira sp.]